MEKKLKINLILNDLNQGWIIQKFAERMQASLIKLDHNVSIQRVPSNDCDVNHFMSYNFVIPASGVTTAMVTHIDDIFKISHLKKIQKENLLNSLICMSEYTRNRLIEKGLDSEYISFVLPAVDKIPKSKSIKIGLSGRIYSDGRKNEKWLAHISKLMSLENFEFHFFGSGWENIAKKLELSKATVVLHHETESFEADHEDILSSLILLDYWMYLGFDEGSMGSLDAALAGVPLIATPQGFHLNLPHKIFKPVQNENDLLKVMNELSEKSSLSEKDVSYWTWDRYVAEHVKIWEGWYDFQGVPSSEQEIIEIYRPSKIDIMLESLDIVRIRSAIARSKLGLALRKNLKR
jgi:hypothetical protein